MKTIAEIITRRPAATLFVLRAGLSLGMSFGLHFTPEQMSATMIFSEALFALFAVTTTTPNATLQPATVNAAKAGWKP